MAANVKFTVTHPDGTVSRRSSKTRTYTHAVVVERTRQSYIDAELEAVAAAERSAIPYREALATGGLTKETSGRAWPDGSISWKQSFGGTYVSRWQAQTDGSTRYGRELDEAEARAAVQSYLDHAEERKASHAAKAAELEGATWWEVTYGVYQWNSREDLAQKAAASFYDRRAGVKAYPVAVDAS